MAAVFISIPRRFDGVDHQHHHERQKRQLHQTEKADLHPCEGDAQVAHQPIGGFVHKGKKEGGQNRPKFHHHRHGRK